MCGRYTLRRSELESVRRELGTETGGGSYLWQPRYNLAPTEQLPILVRQDNGSRNLVPMVWGIPRNRNGRMVRQINAQTESVSLRIARCAVLSDGFYEWDAGHKGLQRGDVIVSAGNHELGSVSDLAAAVADWKQEGRTALPLSVRRNGQMLGFVPIKIDG